MSVYRTRKQTTHAYEELKDAYEDFGEVVLDEEEMVERISARLRAMLWAEVAGQNLETLTSQQLFCLIEMFKIASDEVLGLKQRMEKRADGQLYYHIIDYSLEWNFFPGICISGKKSELSTSRYFEKIIHKHPSYLYVHHGNDRPNRFQNTRHTQPSA